MKKGLLKSYWDDLRYISLFPRRYKPTKGKNEEYWRRVSRAYGNFAKAVDCSATNWYVITFKDGRKELAFFKVRRNVIPHGGRLCRGCIFHRYWSVVQYEHTKSIRLAF